MAGRTVPGGVIQGDAASGTATFCLGRSRWSLGGRASIAGRGCPLCSGHLRAAASSRGGRPAPGGEGNASAWRSACLPPISPSATHRCPSTGPTRAPPAADGARRGAAGCAADPLPGSVWVSAVRSPAATPWSRTGCPPHSLAPVLPPLCGSHCHYRRRHRPAPVCGSRQKPLGIVPQGPGPVGVTGRFGPCRKRIGRGATGSRHSPMPRAGEGGSVVKTTPLPLTARGAMNFDLRSSTRDPLWARVSHVSAAGLRRCTTGC